MNPCPCCKVEVPNREHRHPALEAIEMLTASLAQRERERTP